MGHMGRMNNRDGTANGFMRESMPKMTAWIDALRVAFGRQDVTLWMRDGLADGTFHAVEAGHEVGRPLELGNAISLAEIVIEAPEPKAGR